MRLRSTFALLLAGRHARAALAAARADLAALPLEDAVAKRAAIPPASRRRTLALRLVNAAVSALLAREGETHPCLVRSLALLSEARRLGYDAGLTLGVRRGPSGIESHAWLVLDEVPFLEPHEKAGSFETIARFPKA